MASRTLASISLMLRTTFLACAERHVNCRFRQADMRTWLYMLLISYTVRLESVFVRDSRRSMAATCAGEREGRRQAVS